MKNDRNFPHPAPQFAETIPIDTTEKWCYIETKVPEENTAGKSTPRESSYEQVLLFCVLLLLY